MPFEILSEFLCRFISGIYDGYMGEYHFDMMTYEGVVGTPENDGFYIRIESCDVFFDDPYRFGIMIHSPFYDRYKFRGRYFLDQDGIVMEMDTFLVRPDLH